MWSFTARLTLMMTERLNLESHSAPNLIDRDIYLLHWRPAPPDDQPDIHGLPSLDHALYLLNTVMFYMGQNYFLFEKKTFLAHLHEFYYGDALSKAMEYKLWFVQYLLVLAFGSAFVIQPTKNTREPPGAKYFIRAMSLMPEHSTLWKDSLLAIEVLGLAGLYLYSIDHRESAHVYVSLQYYEIPIGESANRYSLVKPYASHN